MPLRWMFWKYLVRRLANSFGFLDPFALWGRVNRFAQPSEVSTPVELLRAGVAFHARGLLNTKAIQNNLDWIWPYWVSRQFDPGDESFLPRAFSITHVNLTHRNWTAVGLPGGNALPVVDPRGMVTPFFDGWSLDVWVLPEEGRALFPSRTTAAEQVLHLEPGPRVETRTAAHGLRLATSVAAEAAEAEAETPGLVCRVAASATADRPAWLALSLRPCNPEGISLVESVALEEEPPGWRINDKPSVRFGAAPERHAATVYHDGDVCHGLLERPPSRRAACEVGLATAAALYRLEPGRERSVEATVNLLDDEESAPAVPAGRLESWPAALSQAAVCRVPDERFAFLYRAAVQTLVLLSPRDLYPGPYTYKRFWFRDAVFMLHALFGAGLTERAQRLLRRFPDRQGLSGYFHSQEGEWDANGEVLWMVRRARELLGAWPLEEKACEQVFARGAQWIRRKRCDRDGDEPHAGLLPAGFSAEHFGNNDYYYWDDFWAVAGLQAAAAWARESGREQDAAAWAAEAADLSGAIEQSLQRSAARRDQPGIPASPYRRLDAGAVGVLVASYPLQLRPADDPALLATVGFLQERCFHDGAFFQDMIHSGLNAYLTLHAAQVLLRAGDPGFFEPIARVAAMASPTGQWPEAVHPRTGGGCMGDGQHAWAAAEWVAMMRNLFVREEGEALVLGSGLPAAWLAPGNELRFGPTPTPWGPVTLEVTCTDEEVGLAWEAQWRGTPPSLAVALPGTRARPAEAQAGALAVPRRDLPA